MSLPLNQSLLLESKSFRTSAITNFSDDKALEILTKAKAIIFAVWGGSGWATTSQIAEYFRVTESAVKELYRVNGAEFRGLETKTLTGKDLRDVRQTFCLSSRTPKARVFSPLGALRIAMLLTESEIAAQVRTIILDLVAAIPTTQPPQQPPAPALPPVEQRLHTLVQAIKTLAELTGGKLNPYTEQQFKDFAANLLAEHNRKMLTGSEEKWMGVVNFAESELNKQVPVSGSHCRGHLGTWIRTFYPHLGSRQENRLVNGTQQPVYVYPCHDPAVAVGLTKAIDEFFDHPNPAAALRQAGAFRKKAVVTA
ncbi:hypothetical protein H6G80_24900 [Nostoc sp. FACHB-87]|uniref:hypothetical protein n=1 Tax=Nostocaceae TaxID=1162 RepID=UPI00168667E6|nr:MULTISPECIES: hypothetical protein [Nostocaceae]MBD2457302.1 hypothetical protein [Nostoc sp. FACHB-87]MBD2478371.1 hypothetical protein [Anabaena sp. FACHB-83]